MRIILNSAPRLHAALLVATLLITGACGASEKAGGGRIDVVASAYPLAEVARQVGGDRVAVTDLTPPGAEPHDLELDSDQVDRLEDADVVLFMGGGFQPSVEAAVERSGGETVDVLAEVPGEGGDPHVWLDPTLMTDVVDLTQAALTEADPAGGGAFARHADAYRAELAALDAEYQAGLAQCQRRVIVTGHDAFGYLARRYRLEIEPIAGLSPEAEPDPARLAELTDLIRAQGATTIFTETLVPPDVAETLAREAGVRTAVLDPLEGLSDDAVTGGQSYLTAMRQNLAALREALGCS